MNCPTEEGEVAECVRQALQTGAKLAIRGGGSKDRIGTPINFPTIELGGLRGVIDYDPSELVLSVRPGTPLHEVEALVQSEGQMLAFDPFDHGPVFGVAEGNATIGGTVAARVAGSRRLSAGSARDHLLGLRAVSGRGELFVAGARVVKNVTGFDLPKLMAGSWGRLAVMTELTLKVLPRPRARATCVVRGLSLRDALAAMARAMGSAAEVAAAAFLPGRPSTVALLIEGFSPSVDARFVMLQRLLPGAERVAPDEGKAIWRTMRTIAPLSGAPMLWQINVAPSRAADVAEALGGEQLFDWAGGLVWIGGDQGAERVREIADAAGGHATLVRAPHEERRRTVAFHPPTRGVAALEERVRRAFDPHALFETGRF